MHRRPVFFVPEAFDEYEDARRWYARRSDRAEANFERAVERLLGLIAEHPEAWPRLEGQERGAPIQHFPYTIVYLEAEGQIRVVALAHDARRPGYWRGRLADI